MKSELKSKVPKHLNMFSVQQNCPTVNNKKQHQQSQHKKGRLLSALRNFLFHVFIMSQNEPLLKFPCYC